VETSDLFVIALVVLIPAVILWGLFLSRTRTARSPGAALGIPMAMRPGQPDETLEGKRLERVMMGGFIFAAASALFIVAYWLPEAQRQESFKERFDEESIERGELIYSAPPVLEEDTDALAFKQQERRIALGQACISCHAAEGAGGPVLNGLVDPATGQRVEYMAPPLNNVFTRWDEEVVKFTIERGRPGTPMPAWGIEFGGSMTDQMINDVMNWLKTLPENQQGPPELPDGCDDPDPTGGANTLSCGKAIFEARCALCHGPEGQGKDTDTYYPGMALWQGKVKHLDLGQHKTTVINGRRFAFMPAFGEAPAQGITIPPFPLSDSQINAVVEYERSL
jgi:mono/diheme cytochrome c family protein